MAKHADHEKRRAAFAEAAFNILARDGLAGLTVRDVAREAGFTTGALVHYFPSKSELFVAASEHAALVVRPRMEQDEVAYPGLEGVRRVIYDALPRTPEARALWSVWLVFWDRAKVDPVIGKLARERYAEWHGRLARLLGRAQEAGDLSPKADPELLAQTATILVDGIAVQALRTSARLSPARQKALIDAWIDSLPKKSG
ncbi:HTH-type transcriptional regulator BetI [Alphaproteobacteria bacterium SO-S41]|nr:HTH-type transcriptional regulator BetI [Alphaproteobacteria bacterium SO-S41]